MASDQAIRSSDRDRECASPAGSGVGGNISRRVITSTGEFLDASRSGEILPILVQPGAIHAELIRAHLGSIVADAIYCSLPLALRGETAADRVCLVVPMNRTGTGQLNGEPLIMGNLLAFGSSAELAGASGAPFQCGMLSVAPSELEQTARALHIELHPPGRGDFRVTPVVDRGRLSRAFGLLSCTVKRHKNAVLTKREAWAIEQAFLEIAVRSLAGESSSSSPDQSARLRSKEIAWTCEDYARKWRYQNVTLASLCEASGMSERRVRSAFYECYQMSPTAYLRVTALNAVRRELVEGPCLRGAVSRAATDWGFWHLSRFAAQYRALFGESPRRTLSHRAHLPQVAANRAFETARS
jgi:AraC family transcriptional regulator, ethanolamine operon transcriptional activator